MGNRWERVQRKHSFYFSVCIISNQKLRDLHIGFSLPLNGNFDLDCITKNSWSIAAGNTQLVVGGVSTACGGQWIAEGTVISIEQNRETCLLRYFIDGKHLMDSQGHIYGWRPTNLNLCDFDKLVGYAMIRYNGDMISIASEDEAKVGY